MAERYDKIVQFRSKASEIEAWEEEAVRRGMTLSQWIRSSCATFYIHRHNHVVVPSGPELKPAYLQAPDDAPSSDWSAPVGAAPAELGKKGGKNSVKGSPSTGVPPKKKSEGSGPEKGAPDFDPLVRPIGVDLAPIPAGMTRRRLEVEPAEFADGSHLTSLPAGAIIQVRRTELGRMMIVIDEPAADTAMVEETVSRETSPPDTVHVESTTLTCTRCDGELDEYGTCLGCGEAPSSVYREE